MNQRNWTANWFLGILGISACLLIATLFRYEIESSSGLVKALRTFCLVGENTCAAWWSGILLLLVGLHAYDGYPLFRERTRPAARGWASLAIIFIILSADEISSLHERADRILSLLFQTQIGAWWARLPFALILVALLVYSLHGLSRDKEQRKKIAPLLLGFGLFCLVALQEFIEGKIGTSGTKHVLYTVAEEGMELLAMIVLLRVCLGNTRGLLLSARAETARPFELTYAIRRALVPASVVVAPVLAYVSSVLPDQNRGHPADWLAAVLFVLASVAALSNYFSNEKRAGWDAWFLGFLCLAGSAASVAVQPNKTVAVLPAHVVSLRIAIQVIIFVLIAAAWIVSTRYRNRRCIAPVLVVLGLSVVGFIETRLFFIYAFSQYLALGVYFVNSSQPGSPPPVNRG